MKQSHTPTTTVFNKLRAKAYRKSNKDALHVSDHVTSSNLPEELDLQDVINFFAEMLSEDFQQHHKASKQNHHKKPPSYTDPWSVIMSSVRDLEWLSLAAEVVLSSETGFVSVKDLQAMLQDFEVTLPGGSTCPWLNSQPRDFIGKLLRYLPVLHLKFNDVTTSGVEQMSMIAARPTGGSQMLCQIASLAAATNHAANHTEQSFRDLPIKKYLQCMDTERDRRVVKGIIAQMTSETFVRSAFNWKRDSISKIKSDLGIVEFYVAELSNLLNSVEYCMTESPAVRKRMRRAARVALAQSGFLEQKRGGRTSKLSEYS